MAVNDVIAYSPLPDVIIRIYSHYGDIIVMATTVSHVSIGASCCCAGSDPEPSVVPESACKTK